MKTVFLTTICCFFYSLSSAQINYVTNGSFEEIDSCYGDPASLGFDVFQWSGCVGWSCPSYASSDLWCDNPVYGNQEPPLIPGVGFQYPKSGNNMAGIYIFEYLEKNYREYIQNQLSESLKENQYYQFSINISPGRIDYNSSSCLQIYLSENPLSQPSSYLVIPVVPHWKNKDDNFLVDTVGWQLVEGIFKANGGEKYLTIGCFDNIENMSIKDTNDFTTDEVYYFIDNISLTQANISTVFPNVFTPDGDGINDLFSPSVIGIPDWEITIVNRWGNTITILDEDNPTWDGKINDHKATEGVYFYIFKSDEFELREHGFFHLIR